MRRKFFSSAKLHSMGHDPDDAPSVAKIERLVVELFGADRVTHAEHYLDVRALAEEAMRMIGSLAGHSTIEVRIGRDPVVASCDAEAIQRVQGTCQGTPSSSPQRAATSPSRLTAAGSN